jgi:acetolactate synthase-1/3 small subunit
LFLNVALHTQRVVTFLSLLRPYEILEVARTGIVAMSRPPVEYEYQEQEAREVDISLLPPS